MSSVISSKCYETIAYFPKTVVGNFIMTLMLLHTIHWFSIYAYSNWCIDSSFTGYFANIVNGHGPVCHAIITIVYQAETNIYTLIGSTGIVFGVSWLTDKVLNNKS